MKEVSEGEIQTTTMDHHGLVAAICQDLRIAERINSRLLPDAFFYKFFNPNKRWIKLWHKKLNGAINIY